MPDTFPVAVEGSVLAGEGGELYPAGEEFMAGAGSDSDPELIPQGTIN